MSSFIHLRSILGLALLAATVSTAVPANAGIIVHDRTSASGAIGPEIRTVIGPEIKTAAGQKCGVIAPEIRTVIDPNDRPGCVIGPEFAPAGH
jgi:hypothetical protein